MLVFPSSSVVVSSASKTTNFPYGMPMNYPKGQVGPSIGVVGTNAVVIHPTYTNPTTSVPQTYDVHNSGNDDQLVNWLGLRLHTLLYLVGLVYRLRALVNHLVLSLLIFLISNWIAGKQNRITEGRFKKSANLMRDHRVDRLFKSDMPILPKVKWSFQRSESSRQPWSLNG